MNNQMYNQESQPIDIYQRQNSVLSHMPIGMASRNFRRDSIAHSQGVGGISWGSVTIGSWLKDEVLLHNHMGQAQQGIPSMSPPIQSAYLPDLEANYCKDYSCCGQLLPTLHDLLRHYEESHISPTPPQHQPKPVQNFDTVSTTDVFINSKAQQQRANNTHNSHTNNTNNNNFGFTQFSNQPNQIRNSLSQQLAPHQQQQLQQQQQQQHHQQQQLQAQQQQQHQQLQQHRQIQQQQQQHHQQQQQQIHQGQQVNLTHPQQHQQQQAQFPMSQLQNSQFAQQQATPFSMSMNNDDSAMDLDEEQEEHFIDDPSRNLYVAQGSEKPFTCPVIGCNKTYKNQNGLKYHRLHGHQNQKLHLNPDGTYSVIDPNDGNGMEQDKPYRCEVCGKRYKNLNGLKYHRGHTTH